MSERSVHAHATSSFACRKLSLALQLLNLLVLTACDAAPAQITPREPLLPSRPSADASQPPGAVIGEMADAAPNAADAAAEAAVASGSPSAPGSSPPLLLRLPDPLAELPHGEAQRTRLCGRGLDDAVAAAFCTAGAPRVTSLALLLALLSIDPHVYAGGAGFVLAGHSTSLSKRSVSAINPRAIFLQLETTDRPLLAVAFTRGETFVELVTRGRTSGELEFYAIAFALSCSRRTEGCSPGELLTATIEQDWQSVDVYHEEDLENTTLDCRVCHQPAGPGASKLLRMQELSIPWTHWLHEQTRGGRALLEDYFVAHGSETFAAIPGNLIAQSNPGLLTAFVRLGGSAVQPNEFPSGAVETEVVNSAPGHPVDNRIPGQSPAWEAVYQVALRAESIPVPYHDVKVTAPDKLARMSQLFADYRAGRLTQRALPDIRDVLPDDNALLAEMSFAVDERLDDRALLKAACGLCHNERLDQTLPRARFHTDLARLARAAKDAAMDRLSLPAEDPLAMPPRRIYEMSEAVRARLTALLRQ